MPAASGFDSLDIQEYCVSIIYGITKIMRLAEWILLIIILKDSSFAKREPEVDDDVEDLDSGSAAIMFRGDGIELVE